MLDISGMSLGTATNISNQADKFLLLGDLSLLIIRHVVSVGAREGLATRLRRLRALWVEDLNVVVIIWVDDGGDIEECLALGAVPGHLAEHAVLLLVLGTECVPVADPAVGEGSSLGLAALQREAGDWWAALLSDEDDLAVDAVLGDHVNCVGSGEGDESSKAEALKELHFDS